jgi:hypothetical protein
MSLDSETKRPSWELPDAVWLRMAPCIPPESGKEGHPRTVNLRRITEGSSTSCGPASSGKPVHGSALARPARSTTILPSGSRLGYLPTCGPTPWQSTMTSRAWNGPGRASMGP